MDQTKLRLFVNEHVYLSEIRASDKSAYLEHLREKAIYENTLRIPFPYTEADAEAWLGVVESTTRQYGQPVHWAIRTAEERLFGGIGFDGVELDRPHRAEIGYWLAKPYWGRGIMTAAVQKACEHAFAEWSLAKITAHVFAFNAASARVLEKCGFEQEGYLKKHILKDGRFVDVKLYALLNAARMR